MIKKLLLTSTILAFMTSTTFATEINTKAKKDITLSTQCTTYYETFAKLNAMEYSVAVSSGDKNAKMYLQIAELSAHKLNAFITITEYLSDKYTKTMPKEEISKLVNTEMDKDELFYNTLAKSISETNLPLILEKMSSADKGCTSFGTTIINEIKKGSKS